MVLLGTCEECVAEKPPHYPRERLHLTTGPNGRRLCSKHAREAWREWEENERERRESER